MPLREPDADDPMECRGVVLEGLPGAREEMVRTFASEFARMGWARARVMATFRSPFYAGMHGAWLAMGEERVGALVDEVFARRARPAAAPAAGEGGARA